MSQRSFITMLLLALLTLVPAAHAQDGDKVEPRYRCSAELQACLDWMAKHYNGRGWAGMELDSEGMLYTVTRVHEGTPAAKAKVQPGDVLVAINGVEFLEENVEKLIAFQRKMKPGAQVTYTIKRKGKRRNADFVLVEMPFEVVARRVGTHLLNDHVDLNLALNSDSD